MFIHHIIQTLFLVIGLLSLSAALFNWDWFFGTRNAALATKQLGREKSRWFYGAMGVLLIAAAIGFYFYVTYSGK